MQLSVINLPVLGNLGFLIGYDQIKSKLDRRHGHTQRAIQSVSFKTEILVMFTMICHRITKTLRDRTFIVNTTQRVIANAAMGGFWLTFPM